MTLLLVRLSGPARDRLRRDSAAPARGTRRPATEECDGGGFDYPRPQDASAPASLAADAAWTDAASTDATGAADGSAEDELIRALVQLRGEWLGLLTRTDPVAATISVPQTSDSRTDLAAANLAARVRGSVRYALSTWRYQSHLGPAASASGEHPSKGASTDLGARVAQPLP